MQEHPTLRLRVRRRRCRKAQQLFQSKSGSCKLTDSRVQSGADGRRQTHGFGAQHFRQPG